MIDFTKSLVLKYNNGELYEESDQRITIDGKQVKYETLYLNKMSNDSGSCGAAVAKFVLGSIQEKDLHNLKSSLSNL